MLGLEPSEVVVVIVWAGIGVDFARESVAVEGLVVHYRSRMQRWGRQRVLELGRRERNWKVAEMVPGEQFVEEHVPADIPEFGLGMGLVLPLLASFLIAAAVDAVVAVEHTDYMCHFVDRELDIRDPQESA